MHVEKAFKQKKFSFLKIYLETLAPTRMAFGQGLKCFNSQIKFKDIVGKMLKERNLSDFFVELHKNIDYSFVFLFHKSERWMYNVTNRNISSLLTINSISHDSIHDTQQKSFHKYQ